MDNQAAKSCTGVSTKGGKCSRTLSLVLEVLGKVRKAQGVTIKKKKKKSKRQTNYFDLFSSYLFSPMKREIQNINSVFIILHSS